MAITYLGNTTGNWSHLNAAQALSKTMVTKAINTLSNVFRLKVDKSNTFQSHILPLYDDYIYIQNHKVLKR